MAQNAKGYCVTLAETLGVVATKQHVRTALYILSTMRQFIRIDTPLRWQDQSEAELGVVLRADVWCNVCERCVVRDALCVWHALAYALILGVEYACALRVACARCTLS